MRCARQCQMNDAVARVLRASASEEVRLVLRASCFVLRASASGFSGHCTLYTVATLSDTVHCTPHTRRTTAVTRLQPGQQNSKRKLLALSSVNFL
jgi:hypothetical protein